MSFQISFNSQTENFPFGLDFEELLEAIKKTFQVKYPILEYTNCSGTLCQISNFQQLNQALREGIPGKPFTVRPGASVIDEIPIFDSCMSIPSLGSEQSFVIQDFGDQQENQHLFREGQNQPGKLFSAHQEVQSVELQNNQAVEIEKRSPQLAIVEGQKVQFQIPRIQVQQRPEQIEIVPAKKVEQVVAQQKRGQIETVSIQYIKAQVDSRKSQISMDNINDILRSLVQQEIGNINKRGKMEPFEGSKCSRCGISPIFDVMYQCPQTKITICAKCEEIIDHKYNLLKIRVGQKIQKKEQEKNRDDPENFQELVFRIKEMGFSDQQKVKLTLRSSRYNVDDAVGELLGLFQVN